MIFQEGFQPRGTNTDLYQYASQNVPSVYVPTSTSQSVAMDFASMQEGYVYTIRGMPEGIDVNGVLGSRSPFPHEFEIAVPGGVPPENILRAQPVGADGNFSGPYLANPGYKSW